MNARNSNGFDARGSRTSQQDILERMMQNGEDPRAAQELASREGNFAPINLNSTARNSM